jgi:hypothetical protein
VAERVDASAQAGAPAVAQLPRARVLDGDLIIARLLRTGAVLSGLFFSASVGLELLTDSDLHANAIQELRKCGTSLLVLTPVLRLFASGLLLGLRGEWRFAIYATSILVLLALAVGAGLSL